MPGVLSDTSSILFHPNLILVVKCQYITRDYLITKATMPTNSEAIGAILILQKCSCPELCVVKKEDYSGIGYDKRQYPFVLRGFAT